jgi:hypothetical protein
MMALHADRKFTAGSFSTPSSRRGVEEVVLTIMQAVTAGGRSTLYLPLTSTTHKKTEQPQWGSSATMVLVTQLLFKTHDKGLKNVRQITCQHRGCQEN